MKAGSCVMHDDCRHQEMWVPLPTEWCKSSRRPHGGFGRVMIHCGLSDIFLWCNSFTETGISSSLLLQNTWAWSRLAVEEMFLQPLGLLGNPADWLFFRTINREWNTVNLFINWLIGVIWSHITSSHCWSKVKCFSGYVYTTKN